MDINTSVISKLGIFLPFLSLVILRLVLPISMFQALEVWDNIVCLFSR